MGRPRNQPCDCGVKLFGEGRDKAGRRLVRCSRCRRVWGTDVMADPVRRVGRMPKSDSLALQAIARAQVRPALVVPEYKPMAKKNRRGGKTPPDPTDTMKIEGTVIELRPEEADRFLEIQRAKRLSGQCGPDVESPLIGVECPAEG